MRAVVGVLGVGLGMVVRWRAVAGAGPEVGWIAGGRGLEKGYLDADGGRWRGSEGGFVGYM